MCDQHQLARWAKHNLSRRAFGAGSLAGAAGAAAAACTPMDIITGEDADAVSSRQVSFRTPSGTMDGEFFHLQTGENPGVIFWPDIAGIRDAKRQMSRRLAGEGYAVLLVNPYYRDVSGEQFADFATFAANEGFQKVGPWRGKLDAAAIGSDAKAAAEWLFGQDAVDTGARIGTQGYCMGGPFTIWSAAADNRIGAACSFHGGGLVRDGENSPHRMLQGDVHYLIAIAQDDDAGEPEAKTALRNAAATVGAPAEIEVYPGDHGWCVPDSPAYDRDAAERAWARLLATYSAAL
jgi:carboxymethylenebutenolidase